MSCLSKEDPQDSEALLVLHVGRCFSPSSQSAYFSCGSGPGNIGSRQRQGLQYLLVGTGIILELIPVKQT